MRQLYQLYVLYIRFDVKLYSKIHDDDEIIDAAL